MASQRELDHQYRMAKLASRTSNFRAVVRLGMISAAGATIVFTFRAIAGKSTLADLEFKAFAELHANRYGALVLSWILTGESTLWALGERKLRRRTITRLSRENVELQKQLDPKRRTSHLMPDGRTRPEDE